MLHVCVALRFAARMLFGGEGTLALLCPVAYRVLVCVLARVSPRPVAPRDGPFQGADLRGARFLGSSGIPNSLYTLSPPMGASFIYMPERKEEGLSAARREGGLDEREAKTRRAIHVRTTDALARLSLAGNLGQGEGSAEAGAGPRGSRVGKGREGVVWERLQQRD